ARGNRVAGEGCRALSGSDVDAGSHAVGAARWPGGGRMRLPAFLTQWLDVLAALLIGWHELLRARRSVTIRWVDGRLYLRPAGSAEETELADPSDKAATAREAVRVARGSFIVYELPTSEIVVRRFSIPAQAREFLAGIVGNQIDRLSP